MSEFEIELLAVLRNIGERLVVLLEEHNAIQRQILTEVIGTDIDIDE